MTQIGKCDTCRSRKVKCDEGKPICGACKKKSRPCTYNYGKVTSLVREDPNHFSGHGKAKRAPLVYPLNSSNENTASNSSFSSSLKLATEKEVGVGNGVFQTFTLRSKQRRDSNQQLTLTRSTSPSKTGLSSSLDIPWYTIPFQPICPATRLAARYIHMLGPQILELNPLSIHGSWIESIPSRIGSSPVLDLAVEFAVNAFETYGDRCFSKQKTALISRSKALKALRKGLSVQQEIPSYDILLATKMHSYAEIFVAIGTFAYSYHCLGLSQLLKSGCATGMDREYYWSLVNNTYADEVGEALCFGRPSTYDTEHWRTITHPLSFNASEKSPEFYIESTSTMHVFIQLPRLACLVRKATTGPEDPEALPETIALSKSLWAVDPGSLIEHVMQTSTTTVSIPPDPDIADIIGETLTYDNIQTMMICTRYWMYRVYLCGLLQNLHSHFPQECADASLPTFSTIQQVAIYTATRIAQSLSSFVWFNPSMPLVPLRILQPLSSSIGSWYRAAKHAAKSIQELPTDSPDYALNYANLKHELDKAVRMEEWVIKQCNSFQDEWGMPRVEGGVFEMLVDTMAGGAILDWVVRRSDMEELQDVLKTKSKKWDL